MSDQSESLRRSFHLIERKPDVILPFIAGLIIGTVVYTILTYVIFSINMVIIRIPVELTIIEEIVLYGVFWAFLVYSILWESYSVDDLIKKGNMNIRDTFRENRKNAAYSVALGLIISFFSLIFGFIPIFGTSITYLFQVTSIFSLTLTNLNGRGFISNITGMPFTLQEIYQKEPSTGLVLLMILLLSLIPNNYLFFILVIVSGTFGVVVMWVQHRG